ncbi:hypothetical protein JZ751_012512 [Albula glossodonta]|uniref:E3 ubiquitin-protein transferase MAEA n=1 Tax=Albula glossodonta TaxID=121402 RepID=A0A8T2NX08_9TELE|nr:hypothetical protein JZ751_012512 [Albula glossodonta]
MAILTQTHSHTGLMASGLGRCYYLITLSVPYETLNKRFRAAQKNIDRETSHVTMAVAELEKTLSGFPVVDSVVSLLDGVVEKLRALKRKVRCAQRLPLWAGPHRGAPRGQIIIKVFIVGGALWKCSISVPCGRVLTAVFHVSGSSQQCSMWAGPHSSVPCGRVLTAVIHVGGSSQQCSMWAGPHRSVPCGRVLTGVFHVGGYSQQCSMWAGPHSSVPCGRVLTAVFHVGGSSQQCSMWAGPHSSVPCGRVLTAVFHVGGSSQQCSMWAGPHSSVPCGRVLTEVFHVGVSSQQCSMWTGTHSSVPCGRVLAAVFHVGGYSQQFPCGRVLTAVFHVGGSSQQCSMWVGLHSSATCGCSDQAAESIQAEDESAKLCKRRIEHLKEHSSDQPTAATTWKRKRMDRMMVEHLLRCGYYNTAVKLAQQSGIEDLVNIEMFLTAKEVEESLERQETATCLAWCHDNKSRLRKMKEFIELIRQNKRMDAVRHARKHFSQAEGGQLDEDLLDPARWKMLIQQFRYDNYRLHQLGNNSVFTITLQAGLSAIKTPQCYKEDGSSKNADCPVCSKSLNKLAQPLPMAHCANSRLVCKISGEVMNENNPPMMLPNGYVYGYNSLLSIRQEDKVTCPRTKEVFSFSQAEKVYIM